MANEKGIIPPPHTHTHQQESKNKHHVLTSWEGGYSVIWGKTLLLDTNSTMEVCPETRASLPMSPPCLCHFLVKLAGCIYL